MTWWTRLRHWAGSTVAPSLWPEGAETCPACHRPIPGAIEPHLMPVSGTPTRWPLPTRSELTRLCPIDGPLGRAYTPRPRTLIELRSVAEHLAEVLATEHDPSWARLFTNAIHKGSVHFLRNFGDALAVLLRRGPVTDLDVPKSQLEQLLVDTVAMWPTADDGERPR